MSGAITAIAAAASAAAANAAAILGASSAVIEGVSTFAYSVATIGVTTGISAGIGAAFAPKVPDPQALQIPLKQAMPVRQSAFGRVRVAGSYAYFGTGTGTAKALSIDMLALLDGRSSAFVNFYLNDDLMAQQGDYWWAPGAPGKYGGGGSNPPNLVQIDFRTGLDTETSYSEITPALPLWDSTHRGDGVTSMALYCTPARREDQSGDFPNGVPTPSAVIDAQLVYDPRSGQTQGDKSTYAFRDNPVLCLLAYLTDASGGMGLDYARFILPALDYWIAAADECDGVVTTSGMHATLLDAAAVGDTTIFLADTTGLTIGDTVQLATEDVTVSGFGIAGGVNITSGLVYAHGAGELVYWSATGQAARYRCGGAYGHDTPPGDVVKLILSTFDGWIGQRGDGALIVRSNTAYTPSVTLTDKHILGYQVQHYLPDEQATNQYVVSYTDPAAAFNRAEAGYVQDDGDIASRGQVRSQALDLSWVPSAPQAISVATAILRRNTQPLRGTLTCNLDGLMAMGERFVTVQIPEISALADAVVEITGKVAIDLSSMTASFPFVAVGSATITAPSASLSPLAPPSGSPLQPLAAPTIISVTPEYPSSGGGVSGARLAIAVNDPGGSVTWKVQWKLSTDSVWTQAAATADATGSPLTLHTGLIAAAGSVDVQVAYVTASQVSPWSATSTVTVSAPSISAMSATASEAITAPALVNIWNSSGAKVRNANASAAGKEAHGYILASVANGATATVYSTGDVTGLSSLTPGEQYLAATPGAVTATAPSGTGQIVQRVGFAHSSTAMTFEPGDPVIRR